MKKGGQIDGLKAAKVILATGSLPSVPPIPGIDQVTVHTSDTIFDIKQIPKSIVIIGGGIIGVEFACIFASLNVEITIVETADRIVPSEDPDASILLHKALRKRNIHILTNAKVQSIKQNIEAKVVTIQKNDGNVEVITSDEIVVAAGRRPNLSPVTGLSMEMRGSHISVNSRMETSIPGIYAVGDLIGGWQLAHVASAEGLVAAANAANIPEEVDYKVVPRCIYTMPEIASVGMSEAEAKDKGYDVRIETFHFAANGKALAMDDREGFVKIIADNRYGEILGVTMVGPHVTEMISQASAFIYLEGTVGELGKMIFPHPTLSESMFEAAAAWWEKTYN